MKKIFILFFLLFGSFGCSSYLDIEPEATRDADKFFLAPRDYEQGLIASYDLLQTSYLSIWIGEIASDNSEAGGESPTDTEGLHQINTMQHGGQNNELRSLWRWMYAGITRTNYLFENQNNIEFTGKNLILAQNYFLRAYYYSELVKFFGDVPLIIDKRISLSEAASTKRTPATQVYAQIEADLKKAAETLPWVVSEKGRINKGMALSLLGKVQLYQGKFAESAATLEQVIAQGSYNLFPDVKTLFLLENEKNSESIFDIQYVGTQGGSFDCFQCLEGFVAPGFQGIRQYAGPLYSSGFSYNVPTKDLYNAFTQGDPRREASILDIEAFAAANKDVSYAKGYEHTGYFNNKYIKRANELGLPDNNLTSPLNHKVIRFADVLLMAAEAYNRTGNDVKALQYLNRVRARAKQSNISSSGNQLYEDILRERRWEFAGEGLRFFDLVRTGKAATTIKGFVKGKHELFPIPQVEIDLAGAGWAQNPGY
ncbi:MAG: RagB/SusD family nutrient uptake outer membrane protein [Bacteroidetes bacterium]|nr:MAG: RagB/SusD family nutrient uptake outer membrane protein [Bacteroidota bacterium]